MVLQSSTEVAPCCCKSTLWQKMHVKASCMWWLKRSNVLYVSPAQFMCQITGRGYLLSKWLSWCWHRKTVSSTSSSIFYLSIWLVYHPPILHSYLHASPCFIQPERAKDEAGGRAGGMRFRKWAGKMVSDSEKGRDGKKGQGQAGDEPKLNPEWIHMKVRPGEKEGTRRREWEHIRWKDKVAGRERVSGGWRRERWWKLN